MDDEEEDRREEEEGEQRQFDVEERQLDRILEEEIGVRHRARGDREIEQDEQIGEPQAPADRRRVVDRLLDRLQIVGFGGDWRKVGCGWLGLERPRRGAAFDRRGLVGVGRRMLLGRRSRFQSHGLLPPKPKLPADAGNALFYIKPMRSQTNGQVGRLQLFSTIPVLKTGITSTMALERMRPPTTCGSYRRKRGQDHGAYRNHSGRDRKKLFGFAVTL